MKSLRSSLSDKDRDLVRETEPERLARLDEDELVALHKRVRRARNKHVKVYRRKASAPVKEKGGRGAARPRNARNAAEAEVLEEALARVSARLATVAKASAAELKAERIAAARSGGKGPKSAGPGKSKSAAGAAQVTGPGSKSPARKKREASTLAKVARRQAKRDSR